MAKVPRLGLKFKGKRFAMILPPFPNVPCMPFCQSRFEIGNSFAPQILEIW